MYSMLQSFIYLLVLSNFIFGGETMVNFNQGFEITYFGHSTFKIKSPGGKIIFIDPWIKDNPSCPEELKVVDGVDIIAVTHGHFDHISDVIPLARKFKPTIVSNWEICDWLGTKGVENCAPMNKGGGQIAGGIKFIMTHAQHSSGIKDDDGTTIYGGEPAGFIIELENGFRFYHAGDTNIFSDMKLIGEIYKPELVMLPIGDLFTMSPLEASYACRFLNPKFVIPMHYGTFPPLIGTPDQLEALTRDLTEMEIIALKPGELLS